MKLVYITSFNTSAEADEYASHCMNAVVIQKQEDRWHLWLYA